MRLESRDQANSSNSNYKNSSEKNFIFDENSEKTTHFILKSVYNKNRDKFYGFIENNKLSQYYIKGLKTTLENTLNLKFETPNDLRDVLAQVKNRKYRALALRNLFNFCSEYDLIDETLIAKLKSKIKITEKSNIDSYIPSEIEIKNFLEKVKHYDINSYLFVKILLESGLRVTEVQHFINTFEINKFEVVDQVVVYPLYYLRGSKNSYYLFISKSLFDEVVNSNLREFNVEKLKTWIKRHNLIPLKYTRKYNFTKLIKNDVSFEIANFIQGRVSSNIGFNHYLAKKEIGIKEYQKFLD